MGTKLQVCIHEQKATCAFCVSDALLMTPATCTCFGAGVCVSAPAEEKAPGAAFQRDKGACDAPQGAPEGKHHNHVHAHEARSAGIQPLI